MSLAPFLHSKSWHPMCSICFYPRSAKYSGHRTACFFQCQPSGVSWPLSSLGRFYWSNHLAISRPIQKELKRRQRLGNCTLVTSMASSWVIVIMKCRWNYTNHFGVKGKAWRSYDSQAAKTQCLSTSFTSSEACDTSSFSSISHLHLCPDYMSLKAYLFWLFCLSFLT